MPGGNFDDFVIVEDFEFRAKSVCVVLEAILDGINDLLGLVAELFEGKVDFQEDIKQLDGQKVLLKGFMYPEKDTVGIRRFLLVKDSGDCCFGGQPKLTDMVHVVLNKDVSSATLRIGLVSVSGVFHLKDMRRAGNLNPVYEIEATHFGASKKIY